MILHNQMFGCLFCGTVYHISSRNNRNHCPHYGRGLNYAQKLEWTTW